MRLFIINWQLVVGVGKVVDIVFSHIVFYCTVFSASLYLVVIDALYSLNDLIDFMFLVYIFHFPISCC